LQKKLAQRNLSKERKQDIEKKIRRLSRKVLNLIDQINPDKPHIEKAAQRLKYLFEELEKVEKECAQCTKGTKISLKELKKVLHHSKKGCNESRRLERERGFAKKGLLGYEKIINNVQRKIKHIEDESGFNVKTLKNAVRLIREGEVETKIAKEELVKANLRLVANLAKNFANQNIHYLDLIQEGNIGLMKAIDKYDHRLGYKLSTYATWWIWQAITRAISDQARTIRIPVHMIGTINKLKKATHHVEKRVGREPTSEEISEEIKFSSDTVAKIKEIATATVSLDAPVGVDKGVYLGDFISDNKVASPKKATIYRSLKEEAEKVLSTLSPKEEKVLKMRYGIGELKDYTLEEIGKDLSVTRERIRQIEIRALRKLRHPGRSRKLKVFMER
jgi:RNA polymerase primary sigma factor